jgi:hypothetical protein
MIYGYYQIRLVSMQFHKDRRKHVVYRLSSTCGGGISTKYVLKKPDKDLQSAVNWDPRHNAWSLCPIKYLPPGNHLLRMQYAMSMYMQPSNISWGYVRHKAARHMCSRLAPRHCH